jgi:carboxypeptidase Q
MRMPRTVCAGLAALVMLAAAPPRDAAPAEGTEKVDLDQIHRIKGEAFERSQVMDHLFSLTDVSGPRLTGSPGFRAAADWAVGRLKGWGLADPRLEPWGPFGHGWSVTRFTCALVAPGYTPLHAVPRAFCAGTNGPVEGEVIAAPLFNEGEEEGIRNNIKRLAARLDEYATQQKGKLRGRFVMIDPVRKLAVPMEPAAERLTDAQLDDLLKAPDPMAAAAFTWPLESLPADRKEREAMTATIPGEVTSEFNMRRLALFDRLNAFLRDEGVLGVLASDRRGSGGIVFVQGAGGWSLGTPPAPPTVVLVSEAYNRIHRLLDHKVPVKIAMDLETRIDDSSPDGVNVVAEIPGGRRRDEVVMLGAHLDSWHGGTGATDNAAGCAVALEAVRIIKALGITPDRTVRLALWSGEEQGLLGSRGYVRKHFGDPVTMKLLPEHARLSGYFNLDNGTGRVRGVYLQGNDAMRPIFAAWLEPFRDLGVTTITIRNTFGTDHKSFDAVGLPGFQFIQDPIDYESRTHHSDMDVADRIQPADMMQASAVMAACVLDAANRPAMLPRKPLPPPLPPKRDDATAKP